MPITITQKSQRGRSTLSQNAEVTQSERELAARARDAARFAPSRQSDPAHARRDATPTVQGPTVQAPTGPTSLFFRWLVTEHNAGHAKFRRLRNQAGTVALEITLSMSVARRMSLGSIAGEPFIGLQQRDLDPLRTIEWTTVELRQSRYQAMFVLVGKFADNNIRLVLPANPMSVREFIDPADRQIDLRRVVVAAHGRVSRINRTTIANLRLVRRALLAGSGAGPKRDAPASSAKRGAAAKHAGKHAAAGSFWQRLFG